MKTNGTPNGFIPGLEGIIAAQTRLSRVNGQKGELIIAGYPVEEVAAHATFEEVTYLLWHDQLPNPATLTQFQQTLATLRPLPPATLQLLTAIAHTDTPVMDALRMAAGTLSLDITPDQAPIALVARLPRHHRRLLAPQTRVITHFPQPPTQPCRQLPIHTHRPNTQHRPHPRPRNLPQHRR